MSSNPLNLIDSPSPSHKTYQFKEETPGVLSFDTDNSALFRFMTCPKSAEYYIIHRRESATGTAPLSFGAAIHEGLEALYRGGSLTDAQEAVMRSHIARPMTSSGWRTVEHALYVLERYVAAYPHDQLLSSVWHDSSDSPFVEKAFRVHLGTITPGPTILTHYTRGQVLGDTDRPDEPLSFNRVEVYYTGRMDLAISLSDGIWLVDHKTTTMLGQTFWNDFVMSSQMLGYMWAFEQATSVVPSGVLINCLALRKPTKTGRPIRFERQQFYYTPEKVLEWRHDTTLLITDFISNLIREDFPRSKAWCIGKYGMCPYFNVCAAPDSSRAALLSSSQFQNVGWDPTK